MSLSGGRPFRMSGSCREPLLMSGSGREALPNIRAWLRGPLKCSRVVGTTSQISGSGREALPNVR